MRYHTIGSIGNVSQIGLGTWAMGGDFWGVIDETNAHRAIRSSLDEGVTLIDTAPIYGRGISESIVGKGIEGYPRDKVILATKCGLTWDSGDTENCLRPESIVHELEESLSRLNTDYIDLYQCHWPDKMGTPLSDTMAALMKLRDQGKIREIGVSNFSTDQMDECRAAGALASLQPQFSLLHRDIEADGTLAYCRAHGIAVLSYGSLGAGALTGKYKDAPRVTEEDRRASFYTFFASSVWPKVCKLLETLTAVAQRNERPVAQVSINWVTQQPGMTCALVGAKNAAQAIMNAKAGEWELSLDDLAEIDRAHREIFKTA